MKKLLFALAALIAVSAVVPASAGVCTWVGKTLYCR